MLPAKYVAFQLATLLLSFFSFAKEPIDSPEAQSAMSMGMDSIHANDMCLILGGRAVAGDFFRGLHKHGKRKGVIFKKHSAVVTSFPTKLTIIIDAGLAECEGPGVPLEKGCDRCDFQLNSAFMESVKFEAYWKDKFDMRKADIDIVTIEKPDDLRGVVPSAEFWRYELTVVSQNVPLTNSLLIAIIAPDGRLFSRLSGRL
jgi:hypothetical protein